ncbi:hypothetical protein OUZ56_021571 [Daphnia magna]|uniref:Uncharacterized protein n=1 Tax=Daphnia magna TaxID=35525 RepID=A0ABR0ATX2_9CRUS|nr:hypothetical protein OUZ56_021571 [Daphnia magna]
MTDDKAMTSCLHVSDVHCSLFLHVPDVVIFDVDMLGVLMKLWVPHQAYRALIVTKQSGGTILFAADVLEETSQPRNLFGGHIRRDILGFCG